MDNTSKNDQQNQSQSSHSNSFSEEDNSYNNKVSEIEMTNNGSFLRNKRHKLFKLHKNGPGDLFNTSNEAYSYLNRRLEKLSKNRVSAKKCRLKKKEYVLSLEKKLKSLHKQLSMRQMNEYSQEDALQAFLLMTLPKKLKFLSQRIFAKQITLLSNESIEDFFNELSNIRENIKDESVQGKENTILFDLYVNQLKEFVKGMNEFTDNNKLLNQFYP